MKRKIRPIGLYLGDPPRIAACKKNLPDLRPVRRQTQKQFTGHVDKTVGLLFYPLFQKRCLLKENPAVRALQFSEKPFCGFLPLFFDSQPQIPGEHGISLFHIGRFDIVPYTSCKPAQPLKER